MLDIHQISLDNIKKILRKKGKSIHINKIISKEESLVVEESDLVKVKIQKKVNGVKISPEFPSIGNAVQMLSSLIFTILFFFIQIPFFILVAIVFGQLFSLLYYYPKSLKLKKRIVELVNKNKSAI